MIRQLDYKIFKKISQKHKCLNEDFYKYLMEKAKKNKPSKPLDYIMSLPIGVKEKIYGEDYS